jgi:hypothetical protein
MVVLRCGWRVRRRARPARLGECSLGGASVTGSGILETAIRLQLVSATVRQLSRGELAGRVSKTLDHGEAGDFAFEEGVEELGIVSYDDLFKWNCHSSSACRSGGLNQPLLNDTHPFDSEVTPCGFKSRPPHHDCAIAPGPWLPRDWQNLLW